MEISWRYDGMSWVMLELKLDKTLRSHLATSLDGDLVTVRGVAIPKIGELFRLLNYHNLSRYIIVAWGLQAQQPGLSVQCRVSQAEKLTMFHPCFTPKPGRCTGSKQLTCARLKWIRRFSKSRSGTFRPQLA